MSSVEPAQTRAMSEPSEFSYVPLSPLAPVAAILGALSLSALFSFWGLFVALFATITAGVAYWQIRRADGEIGGGTLAKVGLIMSLLILVGGTAKFAYDLNYECPDGHDRISFARDISAKMFMIDFAGGRGLHEDVEPLIGKPIFIKGFVYQTRATAAQDEFLLLKDDGKCCFGGKPQAWDMIHITLGDGLKAVDFEILSQVAVAGILEADVKAGQDEPVYRIKAVHCEKARTPF